MQVGEVARLHCFPDYAYGPSGFPAWGIQPYSVLVFEIELLRVGISANLYDILSNLLRLRNIQLS
ncbi:putative peptidylprolyl isomerase [Rosa chinensis]|uniref:peptidylprolyl isomerase n=1 Tax=Rosa chinensis TaxID=74649 RepID=A0A2P6QBW9_ROSCH|nr:putative peptidylprolyl isomerase [Rosa chinensis]